MSQKAPNPPPTGERPPPPPTPPRPGRAAGTCGMKLFKLEIECGRRGKDIVVHAQNEDAVRARIAKKYTGWTIRGEIHQIAGEAHFVLADLVDDEDPGPR